MRRYRIAALVVSAVVIALAIMSAQSNLGHVRGIVKDRQGAALPGVALIGMTKLIGVGGGPASSTSGVSQGSGASKE